MNCVQVSVGNIAQYPFVDPHALTQVLQNAYHQRCSAQTIGCLDLHASSFPFSDSVELEAVSSYFGTGILVGTVKPLIGHLEAASGIASLFIVMMQLERQEKFATWRAYNFRGRKCLFSCYFGRSVFRPFNSF